MEEIRIIMQNLTMLLIEACDAYYNMGKPIMTDKEYDKKFKELQEYEEENPDFALDISPTKGVGAEVKSSFAKVTHEFKMLSLDNTYNKEDLESFNRKVKKVFPRATYTIEPKFDGISIDLKYVDNQLVRATTRGNGIVGEDVTVNARQISDIPQVLDSSIKLSITVRGEILMSRAEFEKLNKDRVSKGLERYMNPRNTVAGTMRSHDKYVVRDRNLETRMYWILGKEYKSQAYVLEELRSLGFHVGHYYRDIIDVEDMINTIDDFDKKRDKLPVDTDGMVIKVDNITMWEKIGYTGRAPRFAIAYKYNTEKATTTLNNIVWQVGRTGKLTPVAEFNTVYLAGTEVNRSTLHNMDQIRLKDLRIGDTIIVEKAAEIIPQVVCTLPYTRKEDSPKVEEPTKCPVCGSDVMKYDGKVDLFCSNWDCEARLTFRIEHFISRDAINVMYMGPSMIQDLVNDGTLKKITDIYKLEEIFKHSPHAIERKVSKEIAKAREAEPEALLYGIGIPGVGKTTATKLIREFNSLGSVLYAKLEDLERVVGKVVANSINCWSTHPWNDSVISDLDHFKVKQTKDEKVSQSGIFNGKVFVLTGTMTKFDAKSEIRKIVEKEGGVIGSSVSKNTDYVLYGENPGSKYNKAKDLGITLITESDFLEMIKKIK